MLRRLQLRVRLARLRLLRGPDLRGEFIRGFDNGKGTDSGRSIGTAQAAAFEPQQRLQQYGSGLGQLAGFGAQAPQLPTGGEPSALDKALGTALGVGGLYAKIFAKPQIVVNR